MSRGTDVSAYFASVIQLIASPSLEIQKLVYIYLLHYAESNPDLALLSINTIQKSLGDKNQIVRAMALRVMSGIRVPVISGVVVFGIRKCLGDLSPFVRKTAAVAVGKCYKYGSRGKRGLMRLDPGLREELIPLLATLLQDSVPSVISSALSSWQKLCPERTDLLHPAYRLICRSLVEMNEWGQLVAMRVLTTYVRRCFPKPEEPRTGDGRDTQDGRGFYEEETTAEGTLDPDLELLYKCALQLVHSRSPAVPFDAKVH
jgi:AP-3 complex subunit beta